MLPNEESRNDSLLGLRTGGSDELMQRALREHRQGRFDLAEIYFRRLVSLDENNSLYHSYLGCALRCQEKLNEAILSYRRALEIRPDYPQALLYLGTTLQRLHKWEEAELSFVRLLDIQPDHVDGLFSRGISLQNLGRWEEAELSFVRLLDIQPDHVDGLYNRGISLQNLGRWEEAELSFIRLLDIQPDHIDGLFNRGISLQNLGQWEEAELSFVRLLDIQPGHVDGLFHRGISLQNLGRWEEAAESFAKVLSIQPDHVDGLFCRGVSLQNLGRWEEAAESFVKMLNIQPSHVGGLFHRGISLQNLGRWEEAAESFAKVLSIQPDHVDGLFYRGISLQNLDRWEEAAESFAKVLSIQPDHPEALFQLGFMLQNLQRWEEAAARFKQAVTAKPQYQQAFFHLGYAHEHLGHWAEAAASHARAAELAPSHAQAHLRHGLALERLGRLQDAEASYRAAASIGEDAEALFRLGCLLQHKRELPEAAVCYRRVVTFQPDHGEARLRLASVLNLQNRPDEALACCEDLFSRDLGRIPWSTAMDVIKEFIKVEPRVLSDDEPKKWEYFLYNHEKVLAILIAALIIRKHFPFTPRVFLAQGMVCWEKNMGFLDDKELLRCAEKYDHLRMMVNWEWNLYVVRWAAERSFRVPGDFVEFGVYHGYTTAVVAEYTRFGEQDKRWYLYDTFAGIPEDQRTDGWPHVYQEDNEGFRSVVELFADYPNIEVIRGRVPEILEERCPSRIAFAHFDLNSSRAEIGTLNFIYDRLSPGAVVIFDDYGWYPAREQFERENQWMKERGLEILELPTGQGLFIKPDL